MALARALAVEPKVLLLDEPFGALDATVRAELRAWLRRLHDEQHVTTVLVTHDQEEAMEVSDRIAVMSTGTIEQVGSPREIYDSPATEFVMGFVGPVSRLGDSLGRPRRGLVASAVAWACSSVSSRAVGKKGSAIADPSRSDTAALSVSSTSAISSGRGGTPSALSSAASRASAS